MMVRFGVYFAAFAAFYDCAVGVVVGHFYEEFGFAGAAAIGFIAAAVA